MSRCSVDSLTEKSSSCASATAELASSRVRASRAISFAEPMSRRSRAVRSTIAP